MFKKKHLHKKSSLWGMNSQVDGQEFESHELPPSSNSGEIVLCNTLIYTGK